MHASLIKIGNSKGLRIPKPIIEQCGFTDEVEIEVVNHRLIIKSASSPRTGWSQAFEAMAENSDDTLLDSEPIPQTRWDESEWQW